MGSVLKALFSVTLKLTAIVGFRNIFSFTEKKDQKWVWMMM